MNPLGHPRPVTGLPYLYSIYVPPPLGSQPAIWRRGFVLSDLNSFLRCSGSSHQPWRGFSTWQVEPTRLQKRGWREEVPVLTTSSLRFLCHPLEVKDKRTHRGEIEVLVNEGGSSLYTSIAIVVNSLHSDRHLTFWNYKKTCVYLTLALLTWRIWWSPNNSSKWQLGFKSADRYLGVENYDHELWMGCTRKKMGRLSCLSDRSCTVLHVIQWGETKLA
jgi:hypothetical protein